MQPRDLAERWRATAATLRTYGDDRGALALERCADELRDCLEAIDATPLTLDEAAAVSGFSAAQLRRHIGEGKLSNVGTGRRIAIPRGELPRKPGRDVATATQRRRAAAVQAVTDLRAG